MVFSRSQTQWRRSDMSGLRTGLDYDGVARVAKIQKIKLTATVFQCLQVMEIEVISIGLDRSK